MHGFMNVKSTRLVWLVYGNSLVFSNTILMTSNLVMEFVLREAKPDAKHDNAEEFTPAVP